MIARYREGDRLQALINWNWRDLTLVFVVPRDTPQLVCEDDVIARSWVTHRVLPVVMLYLRWSRKRQFLDKYVARWNFELSR